MKVILNHKVASLCILLYCVFSLKAQEHTMSLSVTGGYVHDGYGGMLTADYKINRYDYLQFNLQGYFTEVGIDDAEVPVDSYAFQAGFFYDILRNNRRSLALSIGGGGAIGYEIVNKGDQLLENGQLIFADNKIVYGAYIGLDTDFFIVPTVAINMKINEYYHVNSDVGEFILYVGAGIKLILF